MNKPRLIDANKLIEHIVNTPSKVINEMPYEPTMFTNIQNRVNEILDAIDNQPTAYDVQEVLEKLNEWRNDITGLAEENEWYAGIEQGYVDAMALVEGNYCEN